MTVQIGTQDFARDARDGLDSDDALGGHTPPLRDGAMRDAELPRNANGQAALLTKDGLDIEHGTCDSTTNILLARVQNRMLAWPSGKNVSLSYNSFMDARVKFPKKIQVRHFVRQWRKHRNLTLEQLAERVGVTHGALSQLERGITNYTQPMLEALADALMCEPADLIMRDPTDPDGIWSIWDQAKPGERHQIVEIAKALMKTGTES